MNNDFQKSLHEVLLNILFSVVFEKFFNVIPLFRDQIIYLSASIQKLIIIIFYYIVK